MCSLGQNFGVPQKSTRPNLSFTLRQMDNMKLKGRGPRKGQKCILTLDAALLVFLIATSRCLYFTWHEKSKKLAQRKQRTPSETASDTSVDTSTALEAHPFPPKAINSVCLPHGSFVIAVFSCSHLTSIPFAAGRPY